MKYINQTCHVRTDQTTSTGHMISQTQLWTNIFCYEGKVRVDVRLTRGMHVGCFPNKGDGIQSKKDTAGTMRM